MLTPKLGVVAVSCFPWGILELSSRLYNCVPFSIFEAFKKNTIAPNASTLELLYLFLDEFVNGDRTFFTAFVSVPLDLHAGKAEVLPLFFALNKFSAFSYPSFSALL